MSVLLVVPMALIKCECGGSAGIHFIDMPFETKQHLMSYSTEGKGEDGVKKKKKSLHDLKQLIIIF